MAAISDKDFLKQSPFSILKQWLAEAKTSSGQLEPHAMTLATLSQEGQVHSRIVLLKELNDQGLIFYSNYTSTKGEDLNANPQTEVVFYWDLLKRQVRVQGQVSKTAREISEGYWKTRPRESQLSQYISHQSQPCPSRQALIDAIQKVEQEFKGKDIPCPLHWGGYLIKPVRFEFWTGQPGRLHDRFEFRKREGSWTSDRLYP